MNKSWQKAVKIIKNGGLAVIPTDTIYGIVASALDPIAVDKLYKVRFRANNKPCIVLCSSIKDLSKFGVDVSSNLKNILDKIWPNPVSVILDCESDKFTYLHKGLRSLAFRVPKNDTLRDFLKKTGPVIAPSANLEGRLPAENIFEAKGYFGDDVNIYLSGKVSKKSSTLIKFVVGKIETIREGSWKVPKSLI